MGNGGFFSYLLLQGSDDQLGLLEEGLITPVGVDLGKLLGNAVVLSGKDGVQHSQNSLLVDSRVTREEAVDIIGRPNATLIGLLELQGKELLHAELIKEGQHLQLSTAELTELTLALLTVGVCGA